MSYVERAFYDYLKSMLIDGIRILLSKKFLMYTILIISIAGSSITVAFFSVEAGDSSNPLVLQLLSIQVALSIAIIIVGCLYQYISSEYVRSGLFFLVFILLTIFLIFLPEIGFEEETKMIMGIFVLFCFFFWVISAPIYTFSFIRGLFSDKLTGSVLFMGKPKEDSHALFIGILVIVVIAGIALNVFLIFMGEYITGGFGLLTSILVFLIIFGWLSNNDVFNSIIGFFYLFSIVYSVFFVFQVVSPGDQAITAFNYIMIAFALLNSSQAASRKFIEGDTDKKQQEMSLEKKKNRKEPIPEIDPYFINRVIIRPIGTQGLAFVLLGTILGFTALQLLFLTGNFPGSLFGTTSLSVVDLNYYFQNCMTLVASLVLLFVIVTYAFSPTAKLYLNPPLYRLHFLPQYENLLDFFARIKEEGWKAPLLELGKEGVKIGVSAGKNRVSKMWPFKLLGSGRKKEDEPPTKK